MPAGTDMHMQQTRLSSWLASEACHFDESESQAAVFCCLSKQPEVAKSVTVCERCVSGQAPTWHPALRGRCVRLRRCSCVAICCTLRPPRAH